MFNFLKNKFKLFYSENPNAILIEYNEIKNKGKKWGKIAGTVALVIAVVINIFLLVNAEPITINDIFLLLFTTIFCYWGYKMLAIFYVWGWYYEEKNNKFSYFIFTGLVGSIVYMIYRNYDKKLKKENKYKY